MIAFRNFALRRGERLLLSNVDIALHAGARIGVVGRNGCGKSSLFAAIQGEIEPDQGDLDLPSRLRIASVAGLGSLNEIAEQLGALQEA